MPDLCAFLAPFVYVYAAAAAGVIIARIALAVRRCRRHKLSVADANWIALLPPLAVLLLPIMVPISLLPLPGPANTFHLSSHQWEVALGQFPIVHGGLHLANVALLIFVLVGSVSTAYNVIQAHRVLRGLRNISQRDETGDLSGSLPVYLLPVKEPLCFTAGLLRPIVFLSGGLAASLNQAQRDIVLTHEEAHAQRRDGVFGCALAIFYGVFRVPGAGPLISLWRSVSEQACDAIAAKKCGSACEVAAVIVMVAKLGIPPSRTVPVGVFSFGPSSGVDLEERVSALLSLVPAVAGVSSSRSVKVVHGIGIFAPGLFLSVLGADYVMRHIVEFFIAH